MSEFLHSYLNEENIKRSKDGVEYHPLIPFCLQMDECFSWEVFLHKESAGQ